MHFKSKDCIIGDYISWRYGYCAGIIIRWINNKMEKRTNRVKEEEKSHDLLRMICDSQDCDNFIRDIRSHKISEKYRVLEQRLHQTSKTNPFKQMAHLNKRFLKDSQHLVKHRNKVQANIELHRNDRLTNNYCSNYEQGKSNIPHLSVSHPQSYFTPKTRGQILQKHSMMHQQPHIFHKRGKNQSNFSIKLVNQCLPGRVSIEKIKLKYDNQTSNNHIERDKQNMTKLNDHSEVDIPALSSKCNSFSTFSNFPSRIYSKQKQELIQLDDNLPQKATQISGFTRHQLFGYYKSLISFSKNDGSKYVAGFETMLNLMNISTNESTVKQLLSSFIAKPSFQEFMNVFERIVESSLKESVVDYFQIVLDGKWGRQLCYGELIQLLSERMSSYHSKEIVEEIYFNLEKGLENKVSVQEIVELCYQNEEFCGFMRGYCQETQKKKLSRKVVPKIRLQY